MEIDGIDVHVEGDGAESIVMIHGWPDTYRLWDAQAAFFRDRYRCVRFTLPGFDIGKPRRAYSLEEVLYIIKHIVEETSPGRKVILMLHDWGCAFGYQFAMRHPGLVSKIVGVDIGDAGTPQHLRSLTVKAKAMVLAYQLWLALAWRIGGHVGDWMTLRMARLARCPSDPRFIDSRMDYPYYIRWMKAHGSYRGMVRFEPKVPMLFVYGERKPFLFHTPEWADAFGARSGNQVQAFATGHWVMSQEPERFNRVVNAWL
ncbi:MAG TPA: alpha/beta hydrolase [Usitatibacter sp.]|jgi:pimeloyl-ACP methyl ester carboxylesterase|nr:alpha/beta hydrolase [Usitatibacter sp.]